MIRIYDKTGTNLQGALQPSSCIVTEMLNGAYELELVHPYDDYGKWRRLARESIILLEVPNGVQPFRIYNLRPTMDDITVNARHIFYDLLDNLCVSASYSGNAQGALAAIVNSMAYTTPFTFETDITLSSSIRLQRVNPVSALLDTDNADVVSFVSAYGGELDRDGYNVVLKTSIGIDRGFVISYGKNLSGLEVTEDLSEVATRIYTVGKDGITGGYVDSDRINDYVNPKIYVLEDSGLETAAQLRQAAQNLIDRGVDLPQVNIVVNFELLANTDEYHNYSILEQVHLGDVVTVSNKIMGFDKKAQVISYEWDALLRRYNKIELGDFVPNIYGTITAGAIGETAASNATSIAAQANATAASASTEVKQVYSMISGIATINQSGLYICVDGSDISTANKIFWFGQNGLQYSTTGINGSWTVVISKDGTIPGGA